MSLVLKFVPAVVKTVGGWLFRRRQGLAEKREERILGGVVAFDRAIMLGAVCKIRLDRRIKKNERAAEDGQLLAHGINICRVKPARAKGGEAVGCVFRPLRRRKHHIDIRFV